ncbi:hypothetical protein ACMFMF_010243 [Clarireedia jacksonii]
MSFHTERRATSRAPSYSKAESPLLPPNLHATTLCAIGPHAMDHEILSRLHMATVRAMGRDFSREEFYLRIEGRPANFSPPSSPHNIKAGQFGARAWVGKNDMGVRADSLSMGTGMREIEVIEPDKKFREFVARCVGIMPRMLWLRGQSGELRMNAKGLVDEVEGKGWWEKVEWGEGVCG